MNLVRRAGLAAVAVLLFSATSQAYPPGEPVQTVLGRKLQIRVPAGEPARATIRGLAREMASPDTLAGDPTTSGATLEVIAAGAKSSNQVFELPASGWKASGNGFKFAGDGAVRKASISRSPSGVFQIKFGMSGAGGDIDVVPPDPGDSGGFTLTVNGGASYCVAFGGDAGGTVKADDAEQWSVQHASGEGCPVPMYTLSASVVGDGSVVSSPAGIDCGADCSESYDAQSEVTLTAEPGDGYMFAGWEGDCAGDGECVLVMDGSKSATANFAPIPFHRLSVTRLGSGTVTSDPAGIDCGADCIEDYAQDTVVALAATPGDGFTFTGWSDACTGSGACEVTMDAARNVVATFEAETPTCTSVSEPGFVLQEGPPPGPAVLYEDAPDLPQLQNRHPRFQAAPLMVAGHEAYVAGEYIYQDYVHDDWGAETSGSPYTTSFITSPSTGTGTPDSAVPNSGDIDYPTDAARYGSNAADLVELRIVPGAEDVAYRVTLNTLLADDTTMVAIAWNSDGANTGSSTLSRNPGASVAGTDEVIYLFGTSGEHVRYNSNGTVAATTPLAVTADLEANQLTTFIPRSVHNPTGTTWKYVVMTGLRNASNGWIRPGSGATATTPGGAGTAAPNPCAIFDLNNHFAIANGQAGRTGEICHFLDGPCDMVQAIDLRGVNGTTPSLAKYGRAVNFDQLSALVSSSTVPASGTLVRLFGSRLVTTPAEGRSNAGPSVPANDSVYFYGPLQAYSIYVPSNDSPSVPVPLTWANHSLAQFHWQYNGTDYVQQLGEVRGSLVVTPNSRATDGFYVGRNEYDHFEVWNDVLRNYNVDATRTAMTGYSMGGYATYRLASLYPDLFGKALSIVGPPAAGIWDGTGGASISSDKGDDYSTLTNHWLENVRNVPFYNMAMQTDELVPVASTRQQNIGGVDPSGEAQSLDGLGYRYIYQEFVTGEHLTLFVNDAYPLAASFLGDALIDENPAHVTFSYVPETDRADLTLVHDHAYWVSRLTLRDAEGEPTTSGSKSAKGTIDAFSFGFGLADPAVSPQSSAPGTLTGGNTGPLAYQEYSRSWSAPAAIPSQNKLQVTLTNLRSVQIDVARAALDPASDLVLATDSDGDTTVDLYGAFPAGTGIYEDGVPLCLEDGAIVGGLGARVPVKAGTHVYTLAQP
ncbi:MAG TPA: alpha/beta hydrolase-fold protein [Candidatus Limnocylindrales bacterium]|nr:alpha/beta hydrolase-fold protein [Candidatus Limnocylindrales bacterium]